ncbi:MAG: prepilin-type N-terminal cleavage/methylation domain-containing protein [Thermodesulfovibrionales bacterium]
MKILFNKIPLYPPFPKWDLKYSPLWQRGVRGDFKKFPLFHSTFSPKSRNGFTLLEVIVVIGIISLMVGILVPMVYRIWESNEIDITKERMRDLKIAMVGDPKLIQNGVRTNFGFVGDNGQLPDNGELPGTISNALLPHMPSGYNPNKYNKDAWGKEFEYKIVATDAEGRRVSATLKSAGPDGILGGLSTDDIDEVIAHKNYTPDAFIAAGEVTPANIIQGNVSIMLQTAPVAAKNIYIGVSVRYRSGDGTLTTKICCDNNMKTISGNPDNTQVNYSQNFNCTPVNNLPVGIAYLTPGLFSDNSCNTSLGGTPLELATSVNNISIFVNLQIQSVP